MFDADFFFGRGFLERVQDFRGEHEDGSLRVEIVTVTGERIDTLQLRAVENGARLYTRDDRLVFLPYAHIAYIDVSILQDFRIPGFQLSPSTDAAAEPPAERPLLAAGAAG